MTTYTSDISKTLIPGLQQVFFTFGKEDAHWKKIFSTWKSEKAIEYDLQMQGLPTALLKNEGASTETADIKQAYTTTYIPVYYSIGFVFTRQAIVDNLYKDRVPMAATNLKNSLRDAKEVQGASVLNNGFNAAYPVSDGKPLLSTTHPILNGTGANTFSIPVGLNEASLNDANILLHNMKSLSGIRTPYKAKKLITTPNNDFTASILTHSKYMPDSATNAVNPIVETGMIPQGYDVNPYLTSPYSWFLLTDCEVGFKYIEREEVFFMIHTDTATQNVLTTATERYAFGNSNWQSVVGSQGAL